MQVPHWPSSRVLGRVLSKRWEAFGEWRRDHSRVLVRTLAAAATLYLLALVASQWMHAQRSLADHIFASDRGSGGAERTDELRPRYPVALVDDHGPVELTFIMESIDLDAQTLSGRVFAKLDPDKYRAEFNGAEPPQTLVLTITGLFTEESFRVPISQGRSDAVPAVPVRFETWGYPQDFPSDSYGSNNFIDIGSGLGVPNVEVVSTGALSSYDSTVAGDTVYLNFLLDRKDGQKWWVYTVTLAPLLLLAVLTLTKRSHRQADQGLMLELGLGILALLPLRQVLVPPDVPHLTRVDLLLGLQLAAFLAFAVYFSTQHSTDTD